MTQAETTTIAPGHIVQERLFIGGEWVAPSGDAQLIVESPVDHREVGRAPDASADDVDRAVRAAREAFDAGPWPRMTAAERADVLDGFADELERRGVESSALVTAEIGQPVRLSRPWVAARPIAHLRYYAAMARSDGFEEEQRPNAHRDGTSTVQYEPLGVAALIVPWNHPHASLTLKLAPALAAGCTLVVKPASESPLDIAAFGEAAIAAGLPPGVLNLVPGGRETGRALVRHEGIDKIGFTGSSATGREIAAEGGRRLIPVTLELGGKSAAIVLPGADLEHVMSSLRGAAFDNTGQTCALMSRILAPAADFDRVRGALTDLAADLRIGDPTDEQTELGPLVSQRIHGRVTEMVGRAKAGGARVVETATSLPDQGYYVSPTIVSEVDPTSEIAQEEVFGPVVTVLPYDDVDDAVRLANATSYGLAGAVFGDPDEANAVARRVRTGSIGINGYRPDLGTPYGGFANSGLGREFAIEGARNYQEVKSIWA
ncbi:MAG: aldehyde dehydrogenase family protein [Pseudoclavibacter sp.]